jgi:serine/threonine-protein kinase
MDPQQGTPQPDVLIGQTIGNYLVTQKLGEGGMGAVYLAEHPSIGKKVALKVLHSEFSSNQEVAARFFHEAKAVNDIGHPNIVDIVDFGIIQAGPGREQLVYFIMEYLAGMTLSQVIHSEAPLPPERALTIGLQVADALSASHKCGIVHRDLKPDNIILVQRGRERDFVKLLDFGIAKLTGGSAMGSHRTRTGIVMGTPAYMSPEQCEGRDTVDLRTDVYALGIVIYEMLTGRVPFLGEGYGEILVQHLTQRPAPVSQFRMLPAHVEVVVMKALEKRADMRYPTMDEFMRAMSDPVGYVEANGGVTGFLQRQLMPSNAPLPPSVRLTPAPLTPPPGTLIAPNLATPAPTTLGSAAGQVHTPRGKTGLIVAGVAVVSIAVGMIIAVAGRSKVPDVGTGPMVASNDPGSDKGAAANPGSTMVDAAIAVADPGSAPVKLDSGITPTFGSETPVDAATAGTEPSRTHETHETHEGAEASHTGAELGSGSATPAERYSDIDVSSTPPGAKILVDGSDTGKVTPATLSVPNKKPGKRISIKLRLKGYNDFTFKVYAEDSSQLKTDLVKAKSEGVATGRCSTPERAGCKRNSAGCCVPEGTGGGGRNNDSGNKTGSAGQGSADRDGLMRP